MPSDERNCTDCTLNCLFANLNSAEPASYDYKREITFKKGETIFKQGTFISKIIIIQEGLAKLFMEGTSGKDLIIRFFGSQDYIGMTQPFGNNESRFTVVALKKTRVCMIEINYFRKLLSKNPSLIDSLFRHFNSEADFLYNRMGILGTKNLQGRLAEAILYLCDLKTKESDIFTHITRKDLAELSAMSVESMIRLLNEFKHDKLINISGKHIEINNMEMMKLLRRVG